MNTTIVILIISIILLYILYKLLIQEDKPIRYNNTRLKKKEILTNDDEEEKYLTPDMIETSEHGLIDKRGKNKPYKRKFNFRNLFSRNTYSKDEDKTTLFSSCFTNNDTTKDCLTELKKTTGEIQYITFKLKEEKRIKKVIISNVTGYNLKYLRVTLFNITEKPLYPIYLSDYKFTGKEDSYTFNIDVPFTKYIMISDHKSYINLSGITIKYIDKVDKPYIPPYLVPNTHFNGNLVSNSNIPSQITQYIGPVRLEMKDVTTFTFVNKNTQLSVLDNKIFYNTAISLEGGVQTSYYFNYCKDVKTFRIVYEYGDDLYYQECELTPEKIINPNEDQNPLEPITTINVEFDKNDLGKIIIKWKKPIRIEDGSTYFVTVEKDNKTIPFGPLSINTLEQEVTGLTPSTKYNITIKVVLGNRESTVTSRQITTKGPNDIIPIPLPVNKIGVDYISDTTFKVTWERRTDIDDYIIYIRNLDDENEEDEKIIISDNDNVNFIFGLNKKPNTNYQILLLTSIGKGDNVTTSLPTISPPFKTLLYPLPDKLKLVDISSSIQIFNSSSSDYTIGINSLLVSFKLNGADEYIILATDSLTNKLVSQVKTKSGDRVKIGNLINTNNLDSYNIFIYAIKDEIISPIYTYSKNPISLPPLPKVDIKEIDIALFILKHEIVIKFSNPLNDYSYRIINTRTNKIVENIFGVDRNTIKLSNITHGDGFNIYVKHVFGEFLSEETMFYVYMPPLPTVDLDSIQIVSTPYDYINNNAYITWPILNEAEGCEIRVINISNSPPTEAEFRIISKENNVYKILIPNAFFGAEYRVYISTIFYGVKSEEVFKDFVMPPKPIIDINSIKIDYSDYTSRKIKISWDLIDANSYSLAISALEGNSYTPVYSNTNIKPNGINVEHITPPLSYNKTYNLTITGTFDKFITDMINYKFTLPPLPTINPSTISLDSSGYLNNTAKISWIKNFAETYNVRIVNKSNNTQITDFSFINPTSISVKVTNDVTYTIFISGNFNGEYSNEVVYDFKLPPLPIVKPTDITYELAYISDEKTNLRLSWKPIPNVKSYIVKIVRQKLTGQIYNINVDYPELINTYNNITDTNYNVVIDKVLINYNGSTLTLPFDYRIFILSVLNDGTIIDVSSDQNTSKLIRI